MDSQPHQYDFTIFVSFYSKNQKKMGLFPRQTHDSGWICGMARATLCPSAAPMFLEDYEESKMKERIIDFKKESLEQTYVQVLFKIGVSF